MLWKQHTFTSVRTFQLLFFLFMSAFFTSAFYINKAVSPPPPFHTLLDQIRSVLQIINVHVTFWSSFRPNHIQSNFWLNLVYPVLSFFSFPFFPPLTSSFFGLVHRPPVYLSLSSPALKLWIGRLVASQSSQRCLRRQAVHLTLSEQKEPSCRWVMLFSSPSYRSSSHAGRRPTRLCLVLRGCKRIWWCVSLLVFFPRWRHWQWHVSFGCHVNIWICSAGTGVSGISAQVAKKKTIKEKRNLVFCRRNPPKRSPQRN